MIQVKNRWTGVVILERETFSGADLRNADLRGAFLSGADLRNAVLRNAVLSSADLRSAFLSGADLSGAFLSGADLGGADLGGAVLRNADLRGADLRGADLSGADLTSAALPHFQIPQGGTLDVWKRVTTGVAKLRVPASAARTASLVGRKCRAERAKVLGIFRPDGSQAAEGWDTHTGKLHYVPGREVVPDSYDPDPRLECTHGIHFFLTREEAEEYR